MQVYQEILQRYWGYEDFRGIQKEIIESIGAGKDTLGLMPTGGGKSITFQVPAMAQKGTCLVITPLIALMKDQVQALRQRGIKAVCISSAMSRQECLTAIDNCILGQYKFLYISPERLASEQFISKLKHLEVSFVTVDEAHCISQWGYDFRPSYLEIGRVREIKPNIPILALTATATSEVIEDIQSLLHFRERNVFRMSFERKNLAYVVYHTDERITGMLQLLRSIPGSCIIYTRQRKHCQELAELLNHNNFTATFYHAGLPATEKGIRQQKWLEGQIRIMVATNAFGMGIDKADVRMVLHMDIPDCIEQYFQEAGRAGRDGKKAYAIMVMDGKELEYSKRRVERNFPPIDYIKDVYEKICFFLHIADGDGLNVTKEFNINEFCHNFKLHPLMLGSALGILQKAGYIEFTDEEEGCSRIYIRATRNELYRNANNEEQKIINSMLRNYGGIFIEYVFLDEDLICKETGLSTDIIYDKLKGMKERGILDYIPKKKIPKIKFTRKRIDKERLHFSKEVYEDRKKSYAYRLKAMQEYCTVTDECRSKMLLKYFNEKNTRNCGICDVCREQKAKDIDKDEFRRIHDHITAQLKNGPMKAYEIDTCGINHFKLGMVLDYMRAEEEITTHDMYIRLNKQEP